MDIGSSRLLRFADLRERGVVRNWPQLKRLVDSAGFPPGYHLSPGTRVWDADVVESWLDQRRAASKSSVAA